MIENLNGKRSCNFFGNSAVEIATLVNNRVIAIEAWGRKHTSFSVFSLAAGAQAVHHALNRNLLLTSDEEKIVFEKAAHVFETTGVFFR